MVEAHERKRPAVSREGGVVVGGVDVDCSGDALARTARSMETRRTVLGEGPKVPEGRLTVRWGVGGVPFSSGEKEKLSMRKGLDFASRGLLPAMLSLPPGVGFVASRSSSGDTSITRSLASS